MVGLDTGFFVEMIKGDEAVIELWKQYNTRDTSPVVSVLTLGELLYLSYRTGTPEVGRALIDNIDIAARVIPVDRKITDKAAALKAGRSIPYTDALILATFLLNDCKTIHTTDRNHFSQIKNKGIKFVFH
jgi:predicted nucleic acid-binding protein